MDWFLTEAFDWKGTRKQHAIPLSNISRVYPDEHFGTDGTVVEFGGGGYVLVPISIDEFVSKTGTVIK